MRRLLQQKGAALVEYVALVGLIGVITVPIVLQLGEEIERDFDLTSNTLSSEIAAATTTQPTTTTTLTVTPPATPPSTPASLPAQGSCEVLPASTTNNASSFPAATCFTYTANSGDNFEFTMDDRVLYLSGYGNYTDPVGGAEDNTIVLSRSGLEAYIQGGDGSDTIHYQGYDFAEFTFDTAFGTYMATFSGGRGDPTVNLVIEDVETFVFDDQTVTIGQIAACIGDGSCSSGPGGPGGPGLGGGNYAVMDGCVTDLMSNFLWCAGPDPQDPLPMDLTFEPSNGQLCAYDPAIMDFVGGDMRFDPSTNDGLACYTPSTPTVD